MKRLNVQVDNDLFEEVSDYAFRYRISRAAAVNCLLSYALEQIHLDYKLLDRDRKITHVSQR